MAKTQKQYTKKPKRRNAAKKPSKYAPGIGGLVGSGLGYIRKNYTSSGSTANKALKLARRLADAVNIEYKELPFTFNNSTSTYNGGSTTINAPIQGTGNGQRIGDSIKVQNVNIKGYFTAGPTNPELWRVLLIWDKQNVITQSNLLDYVGNVNVINGQKLEATKYNSQVLYDQVFKVQPNTTNSLQYFEIFIPVNQHTNFDAGTTNITTGALKILFYTSTATVSSSVVDYAGYISYTDD